MSEQTQPEKEKKEEEKTVTEMMLKVGSEEELEEVVKALELTEKDPAVVKKRLELKLAGIKEEVVKAEAEAQAQESGGMSSEKLTEMVRKVVNEQGLTHIVEGLGISEDHPVIKQKRLELKLAKFEEEEKKAAERKKELALPDMPEFKPLTPTNMSEIKMTDVPSTFSCKGDAKNTDAGPLDLSSMDPRHWIAVLNNTNALKGRYVCY